MFILLIIIPVLTFISAVLLYRHNGKKEILKMDSVQFIYAFILSPLMFVWLKTFTYYLIKNELGLSLSNNELFLMDTILSMFLFYVYAFVVIHSLTKSFAVKRYTDPLYDMFMHSEFFHHEISHLIIFIGSMAVFTFLGTLNIYFPLQLSFPIQFLFLMGAVGIFIGILVFYGMWNFDTAKANFYRLMKLAYGLFFAHFAMASLIFDVPFVSAYAVFWTIFSLFVTLVTISLFFDKPEESATFLSRFRYKNKILRKLKEKILDPYRNPPKEVLEIQRKLQDQARRIADKMK